MIQILYILLGSALVLSGVIGGALADRIRYGKGRAAREARPSARVSALVADVRASEARGPELADVISALTRMGYTKEQAREAASGVAATDRHAPENWIRAALRRPGMRPSAELSS